MENNLKSLLENSASIVPIVENKRSIKGWNKYQNQQATKKELDDWISSNSYDGFGLMMGFGGYHVIDFDQKNVGQTFTGSVFREVWKEIPKELKDKLLVQRTMNGGEHIVYRCNTDAVSQTLVKSQKGKKVIETIGKNNYIIIYDDVASGSWESVPTIDLKDHNDLIETSRKVGERLFKVQVEDFSNNKPNTSNFDNINFISSSAAKIQDSNIDITKEHNDWVKLCYAISNEMGEEGREYFHKISSVYDEYDANLNDTLYDACLRGENKETQATIATLHHLMKKYKVPSLENDGKVALLMNEAITYIKSKGFQLNQFTNKVETSSGEPLTERDVNDIYLELKKKNLRISKNDVASVINSSEIQAVNPLKEWLIQSEESANDEALKQLLACFVLKEEDREMKQFMQKMVMKWVMQIPAMILDDVLPRIVLVAVGKSYIGKSELFRRILPKSLKKYYAESGLDREKDSEILMSNHLLVNVDELAGIMRTNKLVERFKYLSSAKNFTLRVPYGKYNEKFNRKAILCGTANNTDIILDHSTANTRIIPLELLDIDKDKLNAIDRNALFGAITKRYRKVGKEFLYLTAQERAMLEKKSHEHTVINTEQELILKYFKQPTVSNIKYFMTVTDITNLLMQNSEIKIDPRKVSRELNKLGFKKARKRLNPNSSPLSGFFVEEIS